MPVAEFPGASAGATTASICGRRRASTARPTTCGGFVDRAHALGLGVILDVVYNHLGPDGNYLKAFSPDYFTRRYQNEWGEALNFDGPNAGPVREFFIENAGYWIDEFHFDGLRLDATHAIFDASRRARAGGDRAGACARRRAGAATLSWSPRTSRRTRAFVRAAEPAATAWTRSGTTTSTTARTVALTGRNEAYYRDYLRHARRS